MSAPGTFETESKKLDDECKMALALLFITAYSREKSNM